MLDGVTQATYGDTSIYNWTGAAQFSVAENSTMAFASGGTEARRVLSLVWVDRHGQITPLGHKPVGFSPARVSSDGKRIVFTECCRAKEDLWIFDNVRHVLEKQSSEGQSFRPIWSPDESRIAFRSNRDGPSRVYVKELNSPHSDADHTGSAR